MEEDRSIGKVQSLSDGNTLNLSRDQLLLTLYVSDGNKVRDSQINLKHI